MVEQLQEASIGASTEKMREGAHELKQAVTDMASQKFGEYSKQANTLVQENPLTSLAIAFGVGALLGALIFRR